jgi:tetratricopeptide (TPR) repeat protein
MRDFAWRRIREKDLSLRIEIFGLIPRTLASLALTSLSFAGLVVLARSLNPIPSRTRPLNFSAPMVLSLKTWESRSLPGLRRTVCLFTMIMEFKNAAATWRHFCFMEAVISRVAIRMSEFSNPKHAVQKLQQAVREAVQLHSAGNLAGAEKIYRSILDSIPVQYDALHLLGVLKQQQGKLAEARELIEKALKSHPESAEAHSNLGVVLRALDRYEEAVESFDKSLAFNPKDAEVHYNRGTVLSELGRHQEALKSYDRALGLRSDPRTLYNRGSALRELERFDEALASYDRALALLPENVDILNNRANVLATLGRLDEAMLAYDRVLALQPGNSEARENRERVQEQIQAHQRDRQA